MTASVLSPLAAPFHPIMGEEVNPTIFHNGVPVLTVQGSESDFLRTISDEALDDAFPPTAEEAAEMEAAEFFVNLMANLALLEEREEAIRAEHVGLKKRWEARRSLEGKPKAAMHSINEVKHGAPHLLESRDIVPHASMPLTQVRAVQNAKSKIDVKMNKKLGNKMAFMRPIQQPRKHT